jgi:hypothetical protein
MPTLFQSIQGFAGASGVGILCLVGLFFIVSVFATNLPSLATLLISSSNWAAIATVPVLVVAYVVGLLAIAIIDRGNQLTVSTLEGLIEGPIAMRYGQLEQEAEILSGSVVGFLLLSIAALANTMAFPGWTRTLILSAMLSGLIAGSAWVMSRSKHHAAAALLRASTAARATGSKVLNGTVPDIDRGA